MIASADEETSCTQTDTDVAWKAEFRRRIDAVESGRVQLVNGPETLRLARQRVASRKDKIVSA